ncbi:hypothetical protein [Mesorhizobium sp. M0292]
MKYRDHRANGHTKFVAFTLSINPHLFLGAAAVIGVAIGVCLG